MKFSEALARIEELEKALEEAGTRHEIELDELRRVKDDQVRRLEERIAVLDKGLTASRSTVREVYDVAMRSLYSAV